MPSQVYTLRQTPNQDAPLNLFPQSRVLGKKKNMSDFEKNNNCFYTTYLKRDRTAQLCARQVQGSILQSFCRLVAYLCRVVSLRQ